MGFSKERNKLCWCGSEEFWIQKTNKHYEIICTRCKCHRGIVTPGVSVDNYATDIPFQNDCNGGYLVREETINKLNANTKETSKI